MSAKKHDDHDEKPAAAHSHAHRLKFVGESDPALGLTTGTTYDVIDWLGMEGGNVQALVANDAGALTGLSGVQCPDHWEYLAPGKRK